MVTSESAELLRESHPLRTQRIAFSDVNPIMPMLDTIVEPVVQERKPANEDNSDVNPIMPMLDTIDPPMKITRF